MKRGSLPLIWKRACLLLLVMMLIQGCAAQSGIYHEVQPGQTLWRISRVYGIDLDYLMDVNDIQNARQLRPGTLLWIPGARTRRNVPATARSRTSNGGSRDSTSVGRIEPSDGESMSGVRRPSNFQPIWPCRGTIVERFHQNQDTTREGIVVRAPKGTTVRAMESGNVKLAGVWDELPQMGNLVIILHEGNFASVYAHLQTLRVSEGDHVQTGDPIGIVGTTGSVSQPTCYFQLRYKGKARDPILFLGEPR